MRSAFGPANAVANCSSNQIRNRGRQDIALSRGRSDSGLNRFRQGPLAKADGLVGPVR